MGIIKNHRIILIILLLAAGLRLLMLGTVPNGFFRDEAAKGYNAYTLYHTGKDIDGRTFPLFTRELSTYNSALYTYLIIPFIPVVGLNEWSVRLPAALAGVLTILLLYLFLLRNYNQTTALAGSLCLAISPWHLIFSRWANQGIFVPFLLTLFLYAFHRYLETKREDAPKPNGLMWSLLAWSVLVLSIYTYDVMKVFLPLFMISVIFIYRRQLWKDKKDLGLSLLLFCLIITPALVYNFQSAQLSQSRFNRISILSLNLGYFDTFLVFIKNYLNHYSPFFLYITGDHNPRHAFPFSGMMYWFDLPLLLMGLNALGRQKTKLSYLFMTWFFIFPIPASLTIEGIPHALRAITALPVICIISAFGLVYCIEIVKSKCLKPGYQWQLLTICIVFIIVFTIVFQISAYFKDTKSPRYFQYGMKETVAWTMEHQQPGQVVIVSPSLEYPEIFFQFYTRLTPQQLQDKGILFHTTYDQLQSYMDSSTPDKPVMLILAPGELNELKATQIITAPDGYPSQKIVVYTKS